MRHVRKIPGYRYARRTMVPRVRQSSTARAVVHRLFDIDADQRTPLDVAGGNLIAGVGVERLPVVVVIMLGMSQNDAADVDGVVREIAELQVLTGGFRPVIVMDTPRLGAARQWGYPAELLVPEHSWTSDHQPWDDYVRATLASVLVTYRCSASLIVGPAGLTRTDRLVLGALGERR